MRLIGQAFQFIWIETCFGPGFMIDTWNKKDKLGNIPVANIFNKWGYYVSERYSLVSFYSRAPKYEFKLKI